MPRPGPRMPTITFRIPHYEHTQLSLLAERDGVTRTELIVEAIQNLLAAEEEDTALNTMARNQSQAWIRSDEATRHTTAVSA